MGNARLVCEERTRKKLGVKRDGREELERERCKVPVLCACVHVKRKEGEGCKASSPELENAISHEKRS